jgi:Fe-S-cluster-containing dehydrogenase component
MPKQYGMVIDLQRCVGCGACALACKTENNTQSRARGQTYNWADFTYRHEGTFPDVAFTAVPVLCNHCSDAACVKACPVNPKAMHKTPDGVTMHDEDRCLGCRRCQEACPYSARDVEKERAAYSVISANDGVRDPHGFYRDTASAIPNGTASGAEVAARAGAVPPHHHRYDGQEYASVRKKGVVEKCIFCAHRLAQGELPSCVVACPAKARSFGDLNDPGSEPARLLRAHKSMRLQEEKGTKPNVAYVRSFRPAAKA